MGFTLAEVLITLTIIGVIAAMTIPNLIQSYKKHQVEVGLKEAYSILSNAVKMSETENGPVSEWISTYGSNSQMYKYLTPYLKFGKVCGYQNYQNDCVCAYKSLSGTSRSASWQYSTILQNGMSLGIDENTGNYNSHFKAINLYIDINGPKKGNCVFGEDVFVFSVVNNSSPYVDTRLSFFPGFYEQYIPAINKSLGDLLGTDITGGCNRTAPSSGYAQAGVYCASVIARNGWKIPDNYPIKKW